MSPLEITIILHIYSRADRLDDPKVLDYIPDSNMKQHTLEMLMEKGLIRDMKDDAYDCTQKGNAFVMMLMITPPPETSFIDPRTKEVIDL